MKLKNKIAVITGASTGIGRAIAVKLASEGAKMTVIRRRPIPPERWKVTPL